MLTRRFKGQVGGSDKSASLPAEIDLACAADFRIGALLAEPSTLQVQFDETRATLEPRVMQALVALATARGAVVSRDGLVDLCWSGRAVSEDAINRCIAKVRRVGADSGAFEIETIARVGYRLLEHSAAPDVRPVPSFRQWFVPITAVLLLSAVVAGLLLHWRTDSGREIPRVALSGFRALNQEADAKPYSDAMSEAVANALVATGAQLAQTGPPTLTLEEARRADAALIIGGTVRKEGGTIRVTTTIMSGTVGATIVTKDLEAPASEASLLPDRVAASLASTAWLWIAQSRFEPNPAVADEIVRIVNFWGTETRAWDMARQLARANPNSASAQAALALASWNVLSGLPVERRAAALAAGRDAAKRASRLRPEFGFILPCHLTAPSLLSADCDKALRRAVASDAEPPYASVIFASQLAQSGRIREADAMMAAALADSPYDGGRMSFRMFALKMERPTERRGDLPEIQARAQRYAPDTLKDANQYEAAIANGDLAAASAMLNDPVTGDAIDNGLGKDIDNAVFRAVKTRLPTDVSAARAKCVAPPPNWLPTGTAYQTCIVGLTMLGDVNSAFSLAGLGYWNTQCCTPSEIEKRWLDGGGLYYPRVELFGSAMAPFRADPRFITIAWRAGLLAYWKSGHPPDFCDFERVPVCTLLRSH